ncbi:MAG: IclR family transcriptional regulator [Streptosporangiaceae bacterium]
MPKGGIQLPDNQHASEVQGVRSVTRALSLLSAVARGPMTLTALAANSQVSLTTASRLLGTLKAAGYVSQQPDGTYIPGPEISAIVSTSDQWASVRSTALRCVEALHANTNETSAFFVRTGHHRLCIESVESSRLVRRVCPPGERGPVHLGAAGKALIAFSNAEDGPLGLPSDTERFPTAVGDSRTLEELRAECHRIREQGYAFSAMESTSESWAAAAPIYQNNALIGVLTIIVPLTRSDDTYIKELAELTKKVALTANAETTSKSPESGG